MAIWLAPKRAVEHLKKTNPETMLTENSLRVLARNGFPCFKNGRVSLFNMDTFDEDLRTFTMNNNQWTGV